MKGTPLCESQPAPLPASTPPSHPCPSIRSYLFLFLDGLGATGTLMGLCLTFNCAAEVPVFALSGRILERLGVPRALNLAMAAYLLRLLAYLVRGGGFGRPTVMLLQSFSSNSLQPHGSHQTSRSPAYPAPARRPFPSCPAPGLCFRWSCFRV